MEINVSQLEVICHNYWRGECRPSPVNHAYVTNSGSLRVGKLGILTLSASWKARGCHRDSESHGFCTMAQCIFLNLTHSWGSSDNGVWKGT